MIVDGSGAVFARQGYYPYGGERYVELADPNAFTAADFTGQRFDSGTGLHFYNARYYLSGLGRFISADTIVPGAGNPQAFNRYSYVLNNPLRFVDPSGHGYCDSEYYVPGDCGWYTDPGGETADTGAYMPGLNDSGVKHGVPGYENLSEAAGADLTAREAMALVIMSEYGTSFGVNEPHMVAAVHGRYRTYCSGGPWSGKCFNSFWAYMEGWIGSAESLDYARDRMLKHRNDDDFSTALALADALLDPGTPNDFGITPASPTNVNEWVTIKLGQGTYYDHVKAMYKGSEALAVTWIGQVERDPNFTMTMTYSQV